MPAAPGLRFDPQPSRLLAGTLLAAHAVALLSAWVALEGWPRNLLSVVVLVSLGGTLWRALRPKVVSLDLREDGRASWRGPEGSWQEVRMGQRHFVSSLLVILELQPVGPGRATRLILMSDSLPAEEFRRLRTWLRWRRGQARSKEE